MVSAGHQLLTDLDLPPSQLFTFLNAGYLLELLLELQNTSSFLPMWWMEQLLPMIERCLVSTNQRKRSLILSSLSLTTFCVPFFDAGFQKLSQYVEHDYLLETDWTENRIILASSIILAGRLPKDFMNIPLQDQSVVFLRALETLDFCVNQSQGIGDDLITARAYKILELALQLKGWWNVKFGFLLWFHTGCVILKAAPTKHRQKALMIFIEKLFDAKMRSLLVWIYKEKELNVAQKAEHNQQKICFELLGTAKKNKWLSAQSIDQQVNTLYRQKKLSKKQTKEILVRIAK
jgi:hypothetical protein